MSEKGAEEGNPKVINTSIPLVEELEKKEIEEKEAEKKQEEMKETKETKKTMVDTPLVKRKLNLEKESENKKEKFTTIASSEDKSEEKEEEMEEE